MKFSWMIIGWCLAIGTLGLGALGLSSAHAADAPQNVLILFADDWRWDTLGCAGNKIVQTPHLDALAKEGVRFTNACVTTSICGVSRATLFTGQWMSRHGCRGFTAFNTPWEQTYPGILRQAGYWTGHIGKWHNGKFPAEQFDVGKSYMGRHFMKQPDGSQIHVTQKNENDSLEFLRERPKDKPFCLTVAFFAAHAEDGHPEQYLYQEQSAKLYADDTIPVPKTATDEAFRNLPPFLANEKNEGRNRWHWRFDSPEKFQKYMKAYYRLCTEVDATIGKLRAELQAQGVEENTLILFAGDNGYFHAEKGLADKWYPYQESIRVPLIVRDPRLPKDKRGTTNDEFVLNVDYAPTLLAYAQQAIPATMQGKDFAPLYLAADKPQWRQEFYYEHPIIKNKDFIPASEAVVRKNEKYLYWPDFATAEYFDLIADPLEEHNALNDARYSKQIAELEIRLEKLREEAK